MKYLLLSFYFVLIGCQQKADQLKVFKQWHLSPEKKTLDIEKSKSLPQYIGQKDIYLKIEDLIKKSAERTIISEGCEGKIDDNFSEVFNGWSLQELKRHVNKKHFADIMAPIPMKLKAKYPHLNVVCGDDKELMKKNLLAYSDARGFSGFYTRLKQYEKKDEKRFSLYAAQLKKMFPNEDVSSPLDFTLKKSLKAVSDIMKLIELRNYKFLDQVKKYKDASPIVVIGGLHLNHFGKILKEERIAFDEITPMGYENNEMKLYNTLKNNLSKQLEKKLIWFQVPYGFKKEKFILKNLIPSNQLATVEELKELKLMTKEAGISLNYLLSDYDQDGIRDFTLSQSGKSIIITAEDPDWDNDGVDNIVDKSLGKETISNFSDKNVFVNTYRSQGQYNEMKKTLKTHSVKLIDNDVKQEFLVVEVFTNILKMNIFKKSKMKTLRATKQKIQYGKNSYFSYVKGINSLDYYPLKLKEFFEKEYHSRFKGVEYKKFVNQYVVPVIVHSILHEIGHSYEDKELEASLAKRAGWTWEDKEINSLYLQLSRLDKNKMKTIKKNKLFLKKSYKDWLNDYDEFTKILNTNLRSYKDTASFLSAAKKTRYYIEGIKHKAREHGMSFLVKNDLPSLYSLSKPSEWFAEVFAGCFYRKIFKNSSKKIRAIELEFLLGFNPLALSNKDCLSFVK